MNVGNGSVFMLAPTVMILLYFALTVLGVYSLVLFIRLAHRGIKALDLYIDEKKTAAFK